MGFLGGQGQFLDREVEPDRERQSGEDPRDALRQEAAAALLRWDVGEQAGVEGPADDHGHEEEREDGKRCDGDITVKRMVVSMPRMLIPTKMM